jgi:hypothetical protein
MSTLEGRGLQVAGAVLGWTLPRYVITSTELARASLRLALGDMGDWRGRSAQGFMENTVLKGLAVGQ